MTATGIDFVWHNFTRMFPHLSTNVISHSRVGSKMICLNMADGTLLYFMYYTPTNWNLGTKPWRMKPQNMKETIGSEIKEDEEC